MHRQENIIEHLKRNSIDSDDENDDNDMYFCVPVL